MHRLSFSSHSLLASFPHYSFFKHSGTKLPKMRSPSLLGPIALVVYFLCGAALSYRLPVDEIFRRELQKKALVCVEDDTLLSFQQYSDDSVPFCSTYLNIGISTSTVPVTGRTSVCPCPIFIHVF